jgi:hypothetical protein
MDQTASQDAGEDGKQARQFAQMEYRFLNRGTRHRDMHRYDSFGEKETGRAYPTSAFADVEGGCIISK